MRSTVIISMVCLLAVACSSNNTQTRENENKNNLPQLDSAYGLKIGDSFNHDSLETYGFILVKIEPELLDFIPVKLDTSKNGIDGLLNGQVRLVPKSIMHPDNGEFGIECFSVMSLKSINEFKSNFKQIGYVKLKRPYPHVSSSGYVAFNSTGLNNFAETYDYTWEGRAKMISVTKMIE